MSIRRSSFVLGVRCRSQDLLTLRLLESGPVTVIKVVGDLDMNTTRLLTEFTNSVLNTDPPTVLVLDLAALRFFCAAGIRALLEVRDAAAGGSTRLILRSPSPITWRILAVTGMLDTFEIETDPAKA
jgi:anti-anti-sigma factor